MQFWSACTGCNELLDVVDGYGQTSHGGDCGSGDPLVDAYLAAVDADDAQLAEQLGAAIDALDQRPRPLGAAALGYAELGWPVFPLQPGTKIPMPGSRGFTDATTDPDRVRAWWAQHPDANIGLPTGRAFDVLDVDVPAGIWHWVDLRDSGRLPDVHGIAGTPRGGLHVLLEPTGGGNRAGMLPGIDYRGLGGYVVAAPSRRDGRRWHWVVRPSPRITGVGAAEKPAPARAGDGVRWLVCGGIGAQGCTCGPHDHPRRSA